MSVNVTQYELSICCPGDIKKEIEIAKNVINEFNSNFSKTLGISIQIRNWKTDSYPQSGNHPQKILNQQFIDDSDAIVAIFWTRFGTPTDEYGSGTEEEIERMLKSGKQVFLYFSDAPVPPSKVDSEQYQKVLQFKKKHENKAYFWNYNTPEEFKEKLYAHLTKYFLSLSKIEEINNAKKPDIKIELVDTKKESTFEKPYEFKHPQGLIVYKELSEDDIFEDIADMVTVDDITAYNEALPSKDEIDEYNEQQRLYENSQNNCHNFHLIIDNIGNAKANDVYVDLYFPEGVLVYYKDDIEDIKKPQDKPQIPENPIWKAMEEIDKKTMKTTMNKLCGFVATDSMLKQIDIANNWGFNDIVSAISYPDLNINKYITPYSYDYYIKDNKELSIHQDRLLHTRQYSSDEFSLIFTSCGEFEIEYTVMCEEWKKPAEGVFKIKVD